MKLGAAIRDRLIVGHGLARGSPVADKQVQRRLAAILAADVAGYSRLMGTDEEGTLARLNGHRRQLVDPKIREHRGRIVKTTGDGLLVEFASVVDALRCAAEVQRAMLDREADTIEHRRIRFRIGVNLGDIIVEDDDIFGDGVNVAARLEALAEPGGICISGTVRDHVADRLAYAFADMGEQSVKNIARPVRAYAMSAAAVAATPLVAVQAPPDPARRSIAGSAVIAASLVAAIGIGLGVWWAWPIAGSSPASVQAPASLPSPLTVATTAPKSAPRLSIVVLPFTNLSNDPEQEYFADGITDNLTTDLSRISGSFVIARNTAFIYKGKPTDVKQIGRDLGIRYVLEGSVQRTGDQVQVNVQLIDAETGGHLWADRFDTDRANLAKAQNEITARLARSLNLELVLAEANRSERQNAVDPAASDLVMRGWAWMYRPASKAALQKAKQLFERALEIDPLSIDARIGLARALVMGVGGAGSGYGPQDLARAEQLALEAIERDAKRSMAHGVMGHVRRMQHRFREAQIELETALALDPNNYDAVLQLGWSFINLGEPDTAIVQAEKALRLSPRDPGTWGSYAMLGWSYLNLNQVDQAIDYLIKSRAANPRVWFVHYALAGALGLKGDLDAGRAALAESLKLKPEVNSITQYHLVKTWYSAPKALALEDKTLSEGLRRIGFPEK
jgi:TolB-like protein/class 3 adenylate cyclase/Flp pilus assembly protein TadD